MKIIKLDCDSIHVVEGDKIYPLQTIDHDTVYLIQKIFYDLSDDWDFFYEAVEIIKKHGKISITIAQEAIIEGETK